MLRDFIKKRCSPTQAYKQDPSFVVNATTARWNKPSGQKTARLDKLCQTIDPAAKDNLRVDFLKTD